MKALLLSLLVVAAPAAAQVSPPVRVAPVVPNAVTVRGEAVVSAPPDQARLRFGVETTGPTPEQTLREHEQAVQNALTAVRNLGIPDRRIEIEWVGLHERYRDVGERDGYVASRTISVTTDNMALVPALVATVVGQGANRLHGLEYTLEDDDLVENAALEAAFERAREKAEELASAADARLGAVVAIVEQGVEPPRLSPHMFSLAQTMAVDATPGAYSTGASEVRAAVVVTFALEDNR